MPELALTQDMHVHSTFSDGHNTIEENVAEAERIGLVELTCVDHVRKDTAWVPEYVAEVNQLKTHTPLLLHCAVEAKILNTGGLLDVPEDLTGVEAVYAADHQVPSPSGPMNPGVVREQIELTELEPQVAIAWIVAATAAAVRHHESIVIAHLFSVLPKIGCNEQDVPLELIDSLAWTAADAGARIEVDERWCCPASRTLRPFLRRGIPLLLSTDSHRLETIGRYQYCAEVVRELCAPSNGS